MGTTVKAVRHASAKAFLDRARTFLMHAELEKNIILGIAAGLVANPGHAKRASYFVSVEDGETVRLCALRTRPRKLVVGRADREAMVRTLAADAIYPDLDAVVGPEPTVTTFALSWAALAGRAFQRGMRQRIYELHEVTHPISMPGGTLRNATSADVGSLIPWVTEFLISIGDKDDPSEMTQQRVADGALFVWDDGGPVSMAACGGKTPNGVRLSLV